MDESPTERGLRERIDALGPEVRALLLNVLNLADEDRVARIGELWADERTRLFAELLIDVEEDIAVRAFVISELKRARAQMSFGPEWMVVIGLVLVTLLIIWQSFAGSGADPGGNEAGL